MNCKRDDLAYVRSTHPFKYLHGVTVTVREFSHRSMVGMEFGVSTFPEQHSLTTTETLVHGAICKIATSFR